MSESNTHLAYYVPLKHTTSHRHRYFSYFCNIINHTYMHMKIQIYSLVLTFVLLLIPHTGTVNTKLPITLEAANAQLKRKWSYHIRT